MLLPLERRRSLVDYKIVAAYSAGTTSGGLLTATAAWFLSGFAAPLGPVTRVALLCLGAVYVCAAKRGVWGSFLSLPEARRQIPAEVFGSGLVRGAYRFGFELGTGVRTYVPSPAPYLLLLVILLGHLKLSVALLAALGFSLGRAVPLMVRVTYADRDRLTQCFLAGPSHAAPDLATLLVFAGAVHLV